MFEEEDAADAADQVAEAQGEGTSLSAIAASDPGFSEVDFLRIAHETAYLVTAARMDRSVAADGFLLSPSMAARLNTQIEGDEAFHRHHLMACLEIGNGTIERVTMDGSKAHITVRFQITAAEADRDDLSPDPPVFPAIVPWLEDWAFERDLSTRTDVSDFPDWHPGWLVSHKRWVVSRIERVSPLIPT